MKNKLFLIFLLIALPIMYTNAIQIEKSINKFVFISNFRYLILTDTIKNNWIKEPFKPDDIAFCLTAEVYSDQIPDSFKSFIGKEFKVYDLDGKTKMAKIISIKVISEYIPHFGSSMRWEKMSEKEILEERINRGATRLVAELDLEKDFRGFIAHKAGEKDFVIYNKILDNRKDSLIKDLFQKSEYFSETQKEYELVKDSSDDKHSYRSICWLDHSHNISFEHFSASSNEFCSSIRIYGKDWDGFAKNSLTVWRIVNNIPDLFYQVTDTYLYLVLVLDIDSDNNPELILNDMNGYYLVSGKDKKYLDQYTYPNYDCSF